MVEGQAAQEFIEENTRFWERHGARSDQLIDEYVLVDLDSQEPVRLMLNCILAKLLQLKYRYKLIGIIQVPGQGYEAFARSYGIDVCYHHRARANAANGLTAQDIIRAVALHKNPKQIKRALLGLEFDDIVVGDLIYDSYLRIHNLPTISGPSKELNGEIQRAFDFYQLCDWLFDRYNIAGCVLTHRVYIQYGMLGRYCTNKGGFALTMRQKMPNSAIRKYTTSEDFLQSELHLTPELMAYFQSLDVDKILEIGEKEMEIRINGEESEKRMNTHAYHKDNRVYSRREMVDRYNFDAGKPIVFVMCQVFPESHQYPHMIFDDFVEWLEETLTLAADITDVNWLIREHPYHNRYTPEFNLAEYYSEYVAPNPHIAFSSKDLSLRNLSELSDVVVGVGDIMIEASCKGIPCISPTQGPLAHTEACQVAATREEYATMLRGCASLPRLNKAQRDQALMASFRFLADEVNTLLIPKSTLFDFGIDEGRIYKEAVKLLQAANFDTDPLVTHFNYMLDHDHEFLLPYEKLGLL
ncbi:MAG: hypothetical protein QNJ97_21305 [Myxococcota bacterium]|nr:hypothetical protein [Myxococcota bacterium]